MSSRVSSIRGKKEGVRGGGGKYNEEGKRKIKTENKIRKVVGSKFYLRLQWHTYLIMFFGQWWYTSKPWTLRGILILFSVVFISPPPADTAVFEFSYLSTIYSQLALYRRYGLAYPYAGRAFVGSNKKTIESLFAFNPLFFNPWIYMDSKASLLKINDNKVGLYSYRSFLHVLLFCFFFTKLLHHIFSYSSLITNSP